MVELKKQNKKENMKIYNDNLKKLRKELGSNIPIDHVGSTAIPNMYGKNIIDILVGAENEIELNEITNKIISLGYYPGKHNDDPIYRFFASTQEETKSGDVHIHLAIINNERYKDFLTLKKYLLKNKEEVKKYSNLKKEILENGHTDRKYYKSLKSEYVSSLLERARKELR